jgi:transketolase
MKYGERAKQLRKDVLDLAVETGEGHLGGSFSEIEILISLYDHILKPEDKFILSKGHCSYPMYVLLREQKYNPKILTHPDIDEENGIYCTTGSLGHGLPIGVGMALARKMQNKSGKIYVLIGDGECQEGTTWESSLIASKFNLENLITIVDQNGLQALERTEDVLPLKRLEEKFYAFGWKTSKVDGHNIFEITKTLRKKVNRPHMIIAKTVKGKGVSYMENNAEWHGKKVVFEEVQKAYEELK